MIEIKRRLNIFIDESGDFGFVDGSSELYGVSFTLHESADSITNDLEYLNTRLKKANYDGMIHLADLVAKRGDYSYFKLEQRKDIFWSIFYFSKRVKVKIHTVIIDKRFKNNKAQLNRELALEISKFFNSINDYMNEFEKVVVYYDNGQEALGSIIDTLLITKNNVEHRIEFNHKENTREFIQLLQNLKRHNLNFYLVADGLPKMIYDIEHDQTLTFLKRARHIQTTMLNINEIEMEYQKHLNFAPVVTHQIAQLTGGYSFGFQLLGYKLWNATMISQQPANQQTFDAIKSLYIQDLFTQSYDIIFDNLSNHDREYLVGTANNMTTTQIADLMNYQKSAKQQQNYVNQYRRRMIQQDLIIPAGNGRVKFKLPLFKEYLADTQNPDSIRYNPLI